MGPKKKKNWWCYFEVSKQLIKMNDESIQSVKLYLHQIVRAVWLPFTFLFFLHKFGYTWGLFADCLIIWPLMSPATADFLLCYPRSLQLTWWLELSFKVGVTCGGTRFPALTKRLPRRTYKKWNNGNRRTKTETDFFFLLIERHWFLVRLSWQQAALALTSK